MNNPAAETAGYQKKDTKNIVIPRPPITTFEGMLNRGIQRKYKKLDCPVKPDNDGHTKTR
ncbi:MAG: hypothetical protein IBX72_04940 [Nitrospirae bacterium]|nr:hypothetical protein [Nitrospirota bacterium]